MSAEKFEAFLAKLYVDEKARLHFMADPRREAISSGLTDDDCAALQKMDFVGLELAAHSYARKRATSPPKKPASNLARWFRRRQ